MRSRELQNVLGCSLYSCTSQSGTLTQLGPPVSQAAGSAPGSRPAAGSAAQTAADGARASM